MRLTNYAIESGIISVAVYQTPNQPITFVDDPLPNIYKNGRSEDGIIARTWSMFKDDPTEPDVLLRSGIKPEVNRKLMRNGQMNRKLTGSEPEILGDPFKITNDKRSCKVY